MLKQRTKLLSTNNLNIGFKEDDLNDPDAEQWFKAEHSKSNKIEYLHTKKEYPELNKATKEPWETELAKKEKKFLRYKKQKYFHNFLLATTWWNKNTATKPAVHIDQ